MASAQHTTSHHHDLRLWYRQPASLTELMSSGKGPQAGSPSIVDADSRIWQETVMPIGNGDLGGAIFGEISRDRIGFNEKTLWTGGPGSTPTYDGGNSVEHGRNGQTLRSVQHLFEQGRREEAARLASNTLIGGFNAAEQGGYQAWGTVYLDYGFADDHYSNYERDLNLSTGIAHVAFDHDGTHITREYFASNPDNVLVMHLTSTTTQTLAVSFPTKQDSQKNAERTTVDVAGGLLEVSGALHNNGLRYASAIKVASTDGEISDGGDHLSIAGCTHVSLLVSAATDYALTYPAYRTGESPRDVSRRVRAVLEEAAARSIDDLRERHQRDYSALFDRVELDLGQCDAKNAGQCDGGEADQCARTVPTDVLLDAYRAGDASPAQQRELEVVLFQYGRYLGISSSRENSLLPANLQGVWANRSDDTVGPNAWNSDYHLNVNMQMIYWAAYSTNLVETADPMIRFMKALVEPGRRTARIYLGTDGSEGSGFSAHTENTPFGWTTPGRDFFWGWSPAAVPWMLHNVYEWYEFTGDTERLREDIYPLLKEQADLYVQRLLHPSTDSTGTRRLVSSPAYSPEHGPVTDGNVYEQTLIWQMLTDAIEAAEVLQVDADRLTMDESCSIDDWERDWENGGAFTSDASRSWACARQLLDPIVIGDSGQIKEWYDEGALGHHTDGSAIADYQCYHRHMSHMLGLYPGDLITVDHAEFLDAAKVSMNDRSDRATGWGIAQRLNSWARAGDGERAHRIIQSLFANGIYPNLFDTHPPFQIDGNFGYTAGVSEMLLQSNSTWVGQDGREYRNYMYPAPALPRVWRNGRVSGLRARGNFTVGYEWADGAVTLMTITSGSGGHAVVRLSGALNATVTSADGACVGSTLLDATHLAFDTRPGETYTITHLTEEA